MKTNDDRQHLTQAQPRFAVTLFWGPCQQVLLPARLKELAKVVNGAKNRYSIHRNLPPMIKVCLLYPLLSLGYAGSFFISLTSSSRYSKLKGAPAGIIRRRQEIEERLDKEQKLLVTLPSLDITQTG